MSETGRVIHSIGAAPQITLERMRNGEAILRPLPANDWESSVVFNAAAVLVEENEEIGRIGSGIGLSGGRIEALRAAGGMTVMLYRAQGSLETAAGERPSSLGLAVFTPDLELVYRSDRPVFGFDASHRSLGAEDPRCTRIEDTFVVYYVGLSAADKGDVDGRRVRVCVCTTRDFVHWQDHGPVAGDINVVNNKNAALIPRPVHGKWHLLHRPMEGPNAMQIHLATADKPMGPWYGKGPIIAARVYREFSKSWIGAAGPPIHLENDRFLMIYHLGNMTASGRKEYDLGAALLAPGKTRPVTARMEPVLRPLQAGERVGDSRLGVDNVVFSCANYVWNEELIVPYAGADSRMFGAKVGLYALVRALNKEAGRLQE